MMRRKRFKLGGGITPTTQITLRTMMLGVKEYIGPNLLTRITSIRSTTLITPRTLPMDKSGAHNVCNMHNPHNMHIT